MRGRLEVLRFRKKKKEVRDLVNEVRGLEKKDRGLIGYWFRKKRLEVYRLEV